MKAIKKIYALSLILLLGVGNVQADEQVLQVKPFTVESYAKGDTCYFEMQMKTDSLQQSFQFDMQLPMGMEIDSIKVNKTMLPLTTKVDYNCIDDKENKYRVLCWNSLPNSEIKYSNVASLRVYYSFNAESSSKIQPIKVDYALLASTEAKGFRETNLPLSSSFIMLYNKNFTSAAYSDYSGLEGYVPSFACSQISDNANYDLTLKSLKLQNVDSLGSPITAYNENAIIYCKYQSKAYEREENVRDHNIVAVDVNSGAGYSSNIQLYGNNADFADKKIAGDFEVLYNVKADRFALGRNFLIGKYTSVYLPLTLSTTDFDRLFTQNGIKAYQITASDVNAGYITCEEVQNIDANKPYFLNLGNELCDSIPEATNVTVYKTTSGTQKGGEVTMMGSYINTTLNSSSSTIYYAFDSENGEYKRVGKNVTLYPFRSYVSVPKTAFKASYIESWEDAPVSLEARFVNMSATGIKEVENAMNDSSSVNGGYNLAGQKVEKDYKGIVIRNGRKEIKL